MEGVLDDGTRRVCPVGLGDTTGTVSGLKIPFGISEMFSEMFSEDSYLSLPMSRARIQTCRIVLLTHRI